MSYVKKIECTIIPEQSFKIIHNCSGCKGKTNYINTEKFRANANGNKLDVWLIYQCEKCKHTYNLTIYERQRINKIPQNEYKLFLENDSDLAKEYGQNFQFFSKNKLEVNSKDIEYTFSDNLGEKLIIEKMGLKDGDKIIIKNSYGLKIREEKLAADILMKSRSQIKKMLDDNHIMISKGNEKTEINILKVSQY